MKSDQAGVVYFSLSTAQITFQDKALLKDPDDSGLVIHDTMGKYPVCGQPVRPWHGHEMEWADRGPGWVTCGNCQRMPR